MARKELTSWGEPRITQKKLRQEQRGDQPLPRVWKVLERKVTLYTPKVMHNPRLDPSKWWEMCAHIGKQQELLRDKGSDYDRAVLDLFTAVTAPSTTTDRPLTRKQFKQLRSDFEKLSPEEIVQERHQLIQDMQELRQDAFELGFQPES